MAYDPNDPEKQQDETVPPAGQALPTDTTQAKPPAPAPAPGPAAAQNVWGSTDIGPSNWVPFDRYYQNNAGAIHNQTQQALQNPAANTAVHQAGVDARAYLAPDSVVNSGMAMAGGPGRGGHGVGGVIPGFDAVQSEYGAAHGYLDSLNDPNTIYQSALENAKHQHGDYNNNMAAWDKMFMDRDVGDLAARKAELGAEAPTLEADYAAAQGRKSRLDKEAADAAAYQAAVEQQQKDAQNHPLDDTAQVGVDFGPYGPSGKPPPVKQEKIPVVSDAMDWLSRMFHGY